jgi:hypothetical protein
VDETPEAQTYAEAVRAPVEAGQTTGGITVTLGSPFEIVRLAFAKTEAGFAEIASWSQGAPLLLDLLADMPGDPPADTPPPDDGADEDDGDDGGGEGGMAGLGLLLLAALPLMLLAL